MTEQLNSHHLQASEIRRYTLLGGLIAGDPSSGEYVKYEDYLHVVKHLLTIIKITPRVDKLKQYNELVKLVKVLLENADEQVIDECVSVHIDDISALNSFLNEFRDDDSTNKMDN